ncbi:MAG: TIGR02221 family CRISPR-associated protein [Alcaligenaceae bacterium]|nr:TIGR02221 family CRISPR-associated protein [Alcaligenaceae bacterium]
MSVDVLISFLGKSNVDSIQGYREATYAFEDGYQVTVPFFGLGLTQKIQPKKLILLGTPSSMWDVFFTNQATTDDELYEQLIEAVSDNSVDDALLAKCSLRLQEKLGCEVVSILIGYAAHEDDQVALLSKLSSVLNDNETVAIDVTHTFRHLPMLALVASRFLQKTRAIQTESIYYGALQMTSEETKLTPVVELSGLLKMLDWVDALSSYEKHGDYADFAELYEREGMSSAAEQLQQAAFFERTNQISRARAPLQKFISSQNERKDSILALFSPILKNRFEWSRGLSHGERQTRLASYFLDQGDYLRAVTLGHEAYLTKKLQQQPGQLDPNNFEHRESIKNKINSGEISLSSSAREAYKNLRNVRNALAHGTPSSIGRVQQAMASEQNLNDMLTEILAKLNEND